MEKRWADLGSITVTISPITRRYFGDYELVYETQRGSPNLKACVFAVANVVAFIPAIALLINVDPSNSFLFVGSVLFTTSVLTPSGISIWILISTSFNSSVKLGIRASLWLFLGVAWIPVAYIVISMWVGRMFPGQANLYWAHVELMLEEIF
jgi:hypothetical protein